MREIRDRWVGWLGWIEEARCIWTIPGFPSVIYLFTMHDDITNTSV